MASDISFMTIMSLMSTGPNFPLSAIDASLTFLVVLLPIDER